ncbi:flavo protein, partial [Fragilariopsis cylindrus CCMP1102]
VLYGSQTGNSEQAAEDFCQVMKEKYTPSYFRTLNLLPITVQPTCLQLDDFLDYQHAAYTKTIVIFVSSYGVGQAPIGSYKFRSFAEELFNNKYATLLKGLRYAICGLGDSNYTTYLVNPTTIDKGLTAAGATRIGDMGKADANAKKQLGNDAQDKVIARWKEELY